MGMRFRGFTSCIIVLQLCLILTTLQNAVAVSKEGLTSAEQYRLAINGAKCLYGMNQHRAKRESERTKRQTDCPPTQPPCPDTIYYSKYRTASGYCNNRNNPQWGMAGVRQRRNIPPQFCINILGTPRTLGTKGQLLPNPREISNALHIENDGRIKDPTRTFMVMAWGQFLDHDITKTPIIEAPGGSSISCCDLDAATEECDVIPVPLDDPFFRARGQTCINFVRSVQVCRNCPACLPEQINAVTSYVDASNVYGSSDTETNNLRLFRGGRLKSKMLPGFPYTFLTPDPNQENKDCILSTAKEYCMIAGDTRVMEIPHLTALHTIWMREHNRIASELQNRNPNLADEIIFQETRRIIGAMIQKITFKDFLPIIIGEELVSEPEPQIVTNPFSSFLFDIFSSSGIGNFFNSHFQSPFIGGSSGNNGRIYNPTLDATIANSFSTAAYRFGHSQIGDKQKHFDASFASSREDPLSEEFLRPSMVLYGGVGNLIRWLISERMAKTDGAFSEEVRNKLFHDPAGVSMDLVALNIKRGRDHGVPPYNDFRVWCGLAKLVFGAPFYDISETAVESLRQLYSDADDIDLFIGGILESPVENGVVGPTFKCIIKRQFQRLREGDRFYYENRPQPDLPNVYFTDSQLREIEQTSLARVICENTSTVKLQPDVFHKECAQGNTDTLQCFLFGFCICSVNYHEPCVSRGKLDLSHWP